MDYQEKYFDEEISQKEDKNSDNNDKITNYEENQNNSVNINNNQTHVKKKRQLKN